MRQRGEAGSRPHRRWQLVPAAVTGTTNQPVTEWGHVFGDEMIAAAVLDRLLHHSHTLVVHGDSYWLKQQSQGGPAWHRQETLSH